MSEENGHVHLPLYQERPERPRVRADCLEGGVNEGRPCPWVGCHFNIVDAGPNAATCVLDVADQGGVTLEEVGSLMGVTRERIRQIEEKALRKIKTRDVTVWRGILRMFLED